MAQEGPDPRRVAPSLAQVEPLIAVTDHGTHTAAADVLRISQPSLSRRIHSLEQALGARLLVPVGRRMELTETGRGVVAAGRRALPCGTSMRQLADASLHGLDARPAQRITTTQRDSLVPLAVAVDGLTIVPAVLARTAPAFGGRVISLREAVRRSIGIVHRPDELPNPALAGFLALVRAADVAAGDA